MSIQNELITIDKTATQKKSICKQTNKTKKRQIYLTIDINFKLGEKKRNRKLFHKHGPKR